MRSPPVSAGSSPLARGTRRYRNLLRQELRLIPARAGNTATVRSATNESAAHPRSRGEHNTNLPGSHPPSGSSPLARGTRSWSVHNGLGERLIPARAGNTIAVTSEGGEYTAHPRSRGEHLPFFSPLCYPFGSSPLARGTRNTPTSPNTTPRLIPARAGNTQSSTQEKDPTAAHPRSRGEHPN